MEATQLRLTAVPPVLVRCTVAALVLGACTAAAMVAISLDLLAWTESDVEALPTSGDLEVPARLTTITVWLAAGVLWAVWLWHALARASSLGALRAQPAVTLTLLFVPVVSWVTTKRALNDLWRITASPPARGLALQALMQAWWTITVLFMVAFGVAFALIPPTDADVDAYARSYRADAVAFALGTVAAALGATVTWALSHRLAAVLASVSPADAPLTRPEEPPAMVAARRAPLAVRACGWIAWGSAALAAIYAVVGGWFAVADPNADALTALELGLTGPLSIALLVPVVLWVVWFHAAVRALHAARGGPGATWVTAAWFVPPWCFVTPWRVLGRLVDDAGHPEARSSLHAAWVTCWLAVAAMVPAAIVTGTTDPGTLQWYAPVAAVSYALGAVCAIALRRVTRAATSA
ncbi:MAG: DUF4328 domain-containing protein [Solirubrobacteraceae bacterium]|nr:DUF4328 domain-containing protein [Solirubrobacteraceae bacterium]